MSKKFDELKDRPEVYINNVKYLGSFFADDYEILNLAAVRTFVANKKTSVLAKPEPYYNMFNRLWQAFDVLRGKASAIYFWEDFQ